MTNIREKSKTNNVHLHIENAFKIIDAHLPDYYVDKVMQKLPEGSKVTKGQIRNIRNRVKKVEEKRIEIVNVLVEIALEYKKAIQKLEKLTT